MKKDNHKTDNSYNRRRKKNPEEVVIVMIITTITTTTEENMWTMSGWHRGITVLYDQSLEYTLRHQFFGSM